MRGKDYTNCIRYFCIGITPAYAGKSSHCTDTRLAHEDHPRLCGEKQSKRSGTTSRHRITPAYAGKSRTREESGLFERDHPRLCGEKRPTERSAATISGSPPPMRGKVSSDAPFSSRARITPAYAGKRWVDLTRKSGRRDHPRLCGEKIKRLKTQTSVLGSPPPMRGKALLMHHKSFDDRITPAYAGKREPVFFGDGVFQDHPRLCGEKTTGILKPPTSIGSPPPMRGKVYVNGLKLIPNGITPAYAGKRDCV